jgi:nicotinate phosphoribosyltransferase
MPDAPRERLAPETFRLPVEKIRSAYYSDTYFALTKELLEAEDEHPPVTMQVFAKRAGLLGGIDEAVAVLRLCSGRRLGDGSWEDGWPALKVRALGEGDPVEPWETVMTIEGDYSLFAHLETVYLGTLARRSLVMTNVRRVVDAAAGKSVLFFPARHDHWLVQTGDGWAAHVAGAIGVSTDANASWWGGRGTGTIPHALIAVYGGDTVAAARLRGQIRVALQHHLPGRLPQRFGGRGGEGRRRAGRGSLGRAARHLGEAGRRGPRRSTRRGGASRRDAGARAGGP